MAEVVEAQIQSLPGDEERYLPELHWHSGVLHGWEKLESFL